MKDIIVVDNFYTDPVSVREYALKRKFVCRGTYPGLRTFGASKLDGENLKLKFEKLLGTKITKWEIYGFHGYEGLMNTCFQVCRQNDQSWVHHDRTQWAGVLYLTPDADPDSGTGFFTHKKTGISVWDPANPETDININEKLQNQKEWELVDEVKNQFNRLVLYNGYKYHRSMVPGFGSTPENARLTQIFFFNT